MSREIKNGVEKKRFIKDELIVKLGKITMSGVLYMRSPLQMLIQQVLLSRRGSMILQLRYGNIKNLERNDFINKFYFEDSDEALRREMTRNNNKNLV